MIGAITGDIIGSVYEFNSLKPEYNFPIFTEDSFFTDDTVLTVALADSILSGTDHKTKLFEYYHLYPHCSYGGGFHIWANSDNPQPYNSWGNGSAMRVSPVGWAYNDLETVLLKAKHSAEVTHNHPEGIKGAQAVARLSSPYSAGLIYRDNLECRCLRYVLINQDYSDTLEYGRLLSPHNTELIYRNNRRYYPAGNIRFPDFRLI